MSRITFVLVFASALFASCSDDPRQGWSTKSVYPTQYATIAVNTFENETHYRQIGFLLTKALVATIESRTPYKVTNEMTAETLLTGRIVNVELTSLSQNRGGSRLDEEVVVGVTIDFNWTNLETDRTIIERMNFEGGGLFVPTTPSREVIELGEFEVVQQLATDVVDELQSAW